MIPESIPRITRIPDVGMRLMILAKEVYFGSLRARGIKNRRMKTPVVRVTTVCT